MVWVNTVGVVGAGAMGHGIAEVVAYAGMKVVLYDVEQRFLDKAMRRIDEILQERVSAGKMTDAEKGEILGRVTPTLSLDAFKDVDFVIEAAPEKMEVKRQIFRDLDATVPERCLLATNTSALSIAAIGAATKRPQRVVGMHFFNPAHKMKLVEVVPSVVTSRETVEATVELAEKCRKLAVVVKDTPGFLVNRILTPILIESIRALDENVASQRDIDLALRAGAGFPMGVFELADMVGLDVALETAETMHRETGDPRYAPPPRLRRMVEAGLLGRKSGRGFYEYGAPEE
ncbi:MAG TPA: 3-hydroxyacyl-CoA dehydrogenase family protein [Thermoplasmata archaeon]|nr:3-hydroxyacyl-CoA dehydrogenase family protein [Thermoplasmata archaeon]